MKEEVFNRERVIDDLRAENTYLRTEIEKCKCVTECCVDNTDYKQEYNKAREQLSNTIKTIKYLSSLL